MEYLGHAVAVAIIVIATGFSIYDKLKERQHG